VKFIANVYPVNGENTVTTYKTTTVKDHKKTTIVVTGVISVVFLALAAIYFVLYKKDQHAEDNEGLL